MNDTYVKLIISHQNKDTICAFFLSTYRFNSVFFTFILSKYRLYHYFLFARQEIEGKITMDEAQTLIDEHYAQINSNQTCQ